MRLELVQLATKVRFGLHPAALEIEPSAFQLALHQLSVGFAVLRKQYPERFGHVGLTAETTTAPIGLSPVIRSRFGRGAEGTGDHLQQLAVDRVLGDISE